MVDIATLGIAVDSRQVKTAQRDLDNLTNTGRRTERQTDQIGQAFRRLAGPLAAYFSVQRAAQAAEEWTLLNNRLRLVTDGTEQLAIAQSDVFRIAQETRQSLSATAELYQRIASNAGDLGLSLAEVSSVVETISQTLVLSGSSAQGAQAALVQLGQAFAAGTLRGEEFNSVIEQAPALAQTLADGMGVSRGELRALAAEGEITAQRMIDALRDMSSGVKEDFDKTSGTVGQAFQKLSDALTKTIGHFDDASGASKRFANVVSDVADVVAGFSDDELAKLHKQLKALEGIKADGGFWKWMTDFGSLNTDEQIAKVMAEIAALEKERKRLSEQPAGGQGGAGDPGQREDRGPSKDFEKVAGRLREQMALYGEVGAAAKVRYQIESGALKDLRDGEAELLLRLAEEYDARVRLTEAVEEQARAHELSEISAQREAQRLHDLYMSAESVLLEQIALYGDTSEAASLRYQLEHGELAKLTEAEKEHLLALREKLDAKEQEAEKARELQEVLDSLRTEEEAAIDAAAEMYRVLDEAFQRGAISLDEYFEATSRVDDGLDKLKEKGEEAGEELSEFAKQAARNMQDAFADFLFDPFDEGLDGMLKNFARILQRMAAEAAAARIFEAIGSWGQSNSGSGGWTGAIATIASAFAGGFDGGGFTGRGPRVGGLDGKGGMLAMVHPNETIIDHTRGQTAGTTVQIGQMVFPGVTTERQAREATGAAARSLSRIAGAGQRYS